MADVWAKYRNNASSPAEKADDVWSKYRKPDVQEEDKVPSTIQEIMMQPYGKLAAHEIPSGLKEGFMKAFNAIQGKPYQESPEPENEWARMGRNVGKFGGQAALAAPIGAAIASTGGAAGIPLAGVIGAAGAGYMTTPGDVPSRAMGALEYGLPVAGGKLSSGLIKTMPSVIAKGLSSAKEAAKELYEKKYGGIFSKAESEGINQGVRIPKINKSLIEKHDAEGFTSSLNEFYKNPTLENAHKAQSDLGKLSEKFKKQNSITALPSEKIKAWREAKLAQRKLRGSMFAKFTEGGSQDLASEYGETTKGYGKNVIPYTKNKSLREFESGDISAPTLIKKIAKNEKFMLRKGNEHPEINQRAMINKLLGLGGKYVLPGLLGGGALDIGYEEMHHLLSKGK